MTDPRDLDPAPFEELAADIQFREFLMAVDVLAAIREVEVALTLPERDHLTWLRARHAANLRRPLRSSP